MANLLGPKKTFSALFLLMMVAKKPPGRLMPVMYLLISNFPKLSAKCPKKIRLFGTIFGLVLTSVPILALANIRRVDMNLLLTALLFFHMTVTWTGLSLAMDIPGMFSAFDAYCWPPERADTKIWKKIRHRAAIEDNLALVATLLEIVGVSSAFAHQDFLGNLGRVRLMLKSFSPVLEIFALTVFFVWLMGTLIAALVFPCCFYYFNWQQQFQAVLFAEYIKDILQLLPSVAEADFYQLIVWRRMKSIIKRHEELIEIFHVRMRLLSIRLTSMFFGVSGASIAIACCFNIMINERVVPSVLLFSVIIIFLEMMSSATQAYEDSHEIMSYAALMVPWYEWNTKNKQAYLLLMQQLGQWVPYKFFNVRVNRAFQVKFLEKVYAAFTILLKTNRN